MKISKGPVLELAVRQSNNAKNVTYHMRAHGWRTQWKDGSSVPADADARARHARSALQSAELVARDAEAILSHVRAWARQEGAA